MPAQVLKNNCTSGELSPLLHKRPDIAQYQNGLETCLNAIVSPYGGAYRRFGTKYIVSAKNSDSIFVLRKFEFSITQAYVLEFGEYYIRYFMDGGQITDGDPVEDTTTYEEDELRDLRFEQSADVLYIFHADHYPAKLTRTSHTEWTLSDCDFIGGPFLDDNETATTLTASAVTGDDITVTASSAIFAAGHVNSLWKLTSGKAVSEVTASISSNTSTSPVKTGGETVELEISGTWSATVTVERSFNNGTDYYAYQTIGSNTVKQYSDTRDVWYRVTVSGYSSGTVSVRLSALDSDGNEQGTFKISAVAGNGLSCTADVVDEIRSTDATTIWAEAAWSGTRGYPRAGKIYEGRLVMACTDHDPTGVWGSSSLDYEDMKLGTTEDEAFYFSLDAKGGVNVSKWMEAWKHLAIGTLGGEIRLVSDGGMTPSNPPDKKQDSDYGSTDIQGFVAGRSIVFVDRSGRILREYAYEYSSDTYDSSNLSVLAEHILNNGDGIVDVAYQQKQDSIIWCVLTDGTIGALTYIPKQNVIGWHRHELGGNGRVESVCVIPGTSGHDEVWMAVHRFINGAEQRFIELMNEDETGWIGTLPTPEISLDEELLTVTMACSFEDANIYFTLDGTTPTKYSFLYVASFTISPIVETIKAIAFHPDYSNSAVATEERDALPLVYTAEITANAGGWTDAGGFNTGAITMGWSGGTHRHCWVRIPSLLWYPGMSLSSLVLSLFQTSGYGDGQVVYAYVALDWNPDAPTSAAEIEALTLSDPTSAYVMGDSGPGSQRDSPNMASLFNDKMADHIAAGEVAYGTEFAAIFVVKHLSGSYYWTVNNTSISKVTIAL